MDKRYIISIVVLAIILLAFTLVYKSRDLHRAYTGEAVRGLNRTSAMETSILTEKDIRHLPKPVQKYITYTGALGKEKVKNVRMVFEGELKSDPKKDFFKTQMEQYNFYDEPTRLFFIKAKMFGLPVAGFHCYNDRDTYMLIKLAGLIAVVDAKGPEMRISDTITLFNDMCFFAPAALIDSRIQWESVNDLTVKAVFENAGCRITAELYFNEKGELINFASDDRYMLLPDGSSKKFRWETPGRDYKEINGMKFVSYAEAIWKLPEGDFCYGKFSKVKEVTYNNENFIKP